MKTTSTWLLACVALLTLVTASDTLAKLRGGTAPPPRIPSIAIPEFLNAGGVSVEEIARLTEQFRQALSEAGAFDVLSKTAMMNAFERARLDASACRTVSCLREAGAAAGTNLISAGLIKRSEAGYIMELRIVQVSNGKVAYRTSERLEGNSASRMNLISQKMASAFGGSAYEDQPAQSAPPTVRNGSSSNKWLIYGGVAAAAIGAGILIGQSVGDGSSSNSNGTPVTPGGALPDPPSFP